MLFMLGCEDADGPCNMFGLSQTAPKYCKLLAGKKQQHTHTRHVQHHYSHAWLLLLFL